MLAVNILGLALIVLIVWWFWVFKPKDVPMDKGVMRVVVEGGTYQPSRLKLTAGMPADIQFLRKDESPCAAVVSFVDFEITHELPLNKVQTISLPVLSKGEYAFSCQMQMYRGTLIVE